MGRERKSTEEGVKRERGGGKGLEEGREEREMKKGELERRDERVRREGNGERDKGRQMVGRGGGRESGITFPSFKLAPIRIDTLLMYRYNKSLYFINMNWH